MAKPKKHLSGDSIRTLDEILADLEEVARNFDTGWRAEPPTMAAIVRRIIRELNAIRAHPHIADRKAHSIGEPVSVEDERKYGIIR